MFTLTKKIKIFSFTLIVLGLLGIAFGFYSAPTTIEESKEMVSHHHHEDDHLIAQKVMAAQSAGLSVILCVGETADARSSGMADTIVLDMLKSSLSDDVDLTRLAIAYEPVWAIGTGQTASQADILDMHMAIKGFLRSIAAAHLAVLYGGSVRADNAASIMAIDGVDGLLIGGASLNAESINAITEAAVQT